MTFCSICDSDSNDVEEVYVKMQGRERIETVCADCRVLLSGLFRGDFETAAERHVDVNWKYEEGTYLRDYEDQYWRVASRLFDPDVDIDPLEDIPELLRRKYRIERPNKPMTYQRRIVSADTLMQMGVKIVPGEEAEEAWSDRVRGYSVSR